jgi:hypothetical protein
MPERSDEFDGYRKWLGIADKKRPPTHYELLAISLDEDDPEVIRAAAEQRRQYVETKRGDGHDSVVTEILFAIGEAEATLLNDEMRRDYDRQLSLFEKRRKNRQVDPFASPSRIRSQPGRTVGEDSGIVKTFVGIMAVICVGFGVMAWFSFQLPWAKRPEHPIAAAPAVPAEPVAEALKSDEQARPATPSPDTPVAAQPKPSPPTENKPQGTFVVTLPRIIAPSHPNNWWSDKGEMVLGGINGNPPTSKPLLFEGSPSPHGIYMHGLISSEVFIRYRLNGRFETFESTVHVPEMLPEQGNPRAPLVFSVEGDSKTLWQSRPMTKKGQSQPCNVSVIGVEELSLKIECRGPDNWALGAWIEPQVYGSGTAVAPPTAASSPVGSHLPMPMLHLSFDATQSKDVRIDLHKTVYAKGKVGRAMQCDGQGFASVNSVLPIGNAPRSIAVWLKDTRGPLEKRLIHPVTQGHKAGTTFGIMQASGKWRFFDFNGGLDSGHAVDREWHHHCVTSDGSTITYYFDGTRSAEVKRALNTAVAPLMLGTFGDDLEPEKRFVGLIDEVKVFGIALSPEQVKTVMADTD